MQEKTRLKNKRVANGITTILHFILKLEYMICVTTHNNLRYSKCN